jgi:zinc protease
MSAARILLCSSLWLCACGSTQTPEGTLPPPPGSETSVTFEKRPVAKQPPPQSGTQREVKFPKIARSQTSSGLELNVVELNQLPVVQILLVVRSGGAADPEKQPGLAQLTAAMLKEGTYKRSSAKLAEAVDFLGARFGTGNDEDSAYVSMQALSEHFDEALGIVAEVATKPSFDEGELKKLKKREIARLQLQSQSPRFLADREFHAALYGSHPYAHIDTTPQVVKAVTRKQLAAWHARHFAPNNAFLVVAGKVTAEQVKQSADKAFAGWSARPSRALTMQTDSDRFPTRDGREVVIVDRPKSVQSVIYYGNLAIARSDPDYVPLMVANQVLGGSAAGRLFMDLREKRSLTYGAYSDVDERKEVGPFMAFASVRNEVTADAMQAFNEHLERIVREAPAAAELADAQRYLIDRFPLRIETPDKIASLVAELRTHHLPDDYWDHFGSEIARVTPDAALAAAKKHIRPSQGVIVVVGEAAVVRPALQAYGPVTVVDTDGKLVVQTPAPSTAPSGAPATPSPAPTSAAPAATPAPTPSSERP